MAFGRPKTTLELSDEERRQLLGMANSRPLPHALVARAKVVLWSVEGESNTQIAERLQWTKATVRKWRKRFIEHRLAGLYDSEIGSLVSCNAMRDINSDRPINSLVPIWPISR